MASSLERVSGGMVPTRRNRALARVEDDALVAAHKQRAIGFVAHAAIQSVTQITALEGECAKLAPGCELRLAAIGDAATAAAQMVIINFGREL